MPELNEKSKKKLLTAIEQGKVTDATTLGVFQMVQDIEDRLDEEIPKITTVLEKIKGDEGKQGIQGIKGDKGDKGDRGEKGDMGFTGKDGKNGRDAWWRGAKGDKGEQGDKGEIGNDGKDGSPDTPEQVRDKLERLKKDERLDASAIKGLTKREDKLTKSWMERAMSILDQRSSFGIQKTEQIRYELDRKIWGIGTQRLTVSAVAPLNPAFGDLWYDIS